MDPSAKESYGPLGELTREEWKRRLESDEGLFRKITEEPPPQISGPILNEQGTVDRDQLFLETSYFTYVADKRQTNYYIELLSSNSSAAREYLLTVTKLKERWKEDLRWLQIALFYQQEKDQRLHQDENLLKEKGHALPIRFPEALKRHYQKLFQDIEFTGLSAQETLKEIKETLQDEEQEERYLEDYLRWAQQEMPFLFEEI